MEKVPKLSEMKKRDAAGYIWDYYRIPIIAAIAGVLFVIYIIHSRLTAKTEILNVVAANCYSLELSESEPLFAEFMEQRGIDSDKYEVSLNTSITYSPGTGNIYSFQALITLINAGRIDVAFWDDDLFNEMVEYGVFMPVSDYLSEDEIAALGNRIVYGEYQILDENGELIGSESYASGIRLTDNSWIEASSLYPGFDPVMTVQLKSDNEETAIAFARYLLEK